MELLVSNPVLISMNLWNLIFCLMVCLIFIHQRQIFVRLNILFFFWFMIDAVFLVLELESYRMEELSTIMPAIEIIFTIVTYGLLLVIAGSIRNGIKNIFALEIIEWLYIGINMIGILFFLLTGYTLIEQFVMTDGNGGSLLITLLGLVPTLLAVIADATLFRSMHQRLRRSSPKMLYIFMIAVFLAILVFIVLKGFSYAASMLTIGMILAVLAYSGVEMRDEHHTAAEQNKTEPLHTKKERVTLDIPVESTQELKKLDEILAIRDEEIKKEEAKASLASENTTLLDLNPHFMYNTLNSVYYLIDQDPSQAKNTVEDLSDYMQGKINMAKTEHMIPIENEMELAKKYLSIQLLRYGDTFHVNYDLQSKGFLVPPLSVTTLVEHAVNSIMNRRLENAEIKISTSQDELCNRISVAYSVKPGEHIEKTAMYTVNPELQEVKIKLQNYCRGAMEILPESDRVVLAIYVPLKMATEE